MVYLNPQRQETSDELLKYGRSSDNSRSFERFQAVTFVKEGKSLMKW